MTRADNSVAPSAHIQIFYPISLIDIPERINHLCNTVLPIQRERKGNICRETMGVAQPNDPLLKLLSKDGPITQKFLVRTCDLSSHGRGLATRITDRSKCFRLRFLFLIMLFLCAILTPEAMRLDFNNLASKLEVYRRGSPGRVCNETNPWARGE